MSRRRWSFVSFASFPSVAGVFLAALPPLVPSCLTYKNDVEKLCDAEHASGIAEAADDAKLADWMERNVASGQGVILAKELSTKGKRDRSMQLRGEATKFGIAACPLADSYEAVSKAELFTQDVTNLCAGRALQDSGGVALLDISSAPDDAERLREITGWSSSNVKSPEAQAIVTRVSQSPPQARGSLLRAEAGKVKVAPCAVADALDAPLPRPAKLAPASPVPTFTVVKYEGNKKLGSTYLDGLRSRADDANICYAAGLARDPKLTGKVTLRSSVDISGKVLSSKDDGSTLADKKVVKCVADAIDGFKLNTPPLKAAEKVGVTMVFTPATSVTAPPMTVALPDKR